MNRVQTLLVIAIVIAFLAALAYQAYGLNLVRLGKTKSQSIFTPHVVQNVDPLASIRTSSLIELAKQNLMGNPEKLPPKPVAPVKPTEPPASIVLTGIVTSTIPGRSSAFIQVNTITKRVFIGEPVDGVAILQEVKNDSVTLKRGDKIEVLRYPTAPAVAAQPMQMPAPAPGMPAQAVVQPAAVSVPVSPGPNRADPRTRLWRLPPDKPGGSPRDTREKK